MRSSRVADKDKNGEARHPKIDAPIELRRHPGARRMTLRVSRTRRAVIVTMPLQCTKNEADTFIDRNVDWVKARLDTVPTFQPFEDGSSLPLRGELHRLQFVQRRGMGPGSRRVVERVAGADGPLLSVSGEPEHGVRRLTDWLMGEARGDIERSVLVHSRRINVAAKRIVIRDQSTRWGSCSTTGVLSFSWRLVMAPPAVLDYVAAHEVAHLIEMNHGPRFWALVAKLLPGHEAAKGWLKVRGAELHRYGPQI